MSKLGISLLLMELTEDILYKLFGSFTDLGHFILSFCQIELRMTLYVYFQNFTQFYEF